MRNVTRFHDAYLLVATKDCPPQQLSTILEVQADAFSLGSAAYFQIADDNELAAKARVFPSIPTQVLDRLTVDVQHLLVRLLAEQGKWHKLLTTEWEVPFHTLASNIREVVELVNEISRRRN